MLLGEVLKGIRFRTKSDISAMEIKSLACDSRMVKDGDLFIAVKGYDVDGYKFIPDAIQKGAKAVLADRDFSAPSHVKKILVRDARIALSASADNFYGQPSRKMKVIGVTGTNGKTTITYIIENIIKSAGKEAGVIGTINYRFKDKIFASRNTTPGPLELQAILADMLKAHLSYAIMEVSSHSLDQGRVDDIRLDTAVFTNITSDHLDYHKTAGNYLRAKAKIFDKLKMDGVAVINNDDDKVRRLKKSIERKVLTYGMERPADVRADDVNLSLNGSSFRAVTPDGSVWIATGLIGKHNVSNILGGITVSLSHGISLEVIKKGIESFVRMPGRLEKIDMGQDYNVFVDYAHTEDALYNVLSLLRGVAKRNIITVFGCGGNRDRTKRPLMGRVSCKYSDKVIITSDNPRFEEPRRIIEEIEKGLKGEFFNYDIVEDRESAIRTALELASKDDIVVIAGKGHEKYQIIKDCIIPFDDCEVVKSILKKEPRV